ncbi:cysteine desulfurase [Nocardioides baekrokdamisoli]|uniref:cysteine desulfurase n=1 Tax=Nocardioides baekrokdamisoli TaxID=1804624 RepID=A0A3G9IGH8_9ACTN|nr:cysteine desulfurase family protein [Nocardioides baekrokdamisoli]BBH18097.1 cysteine desulfurase [Nocardioides baekrokdamisoli]
MTRVYLDHAASTPMIPAALQTLLELSGQVGNSASLHGSGRAARRVVEESREQVAAALGAHPTEVIFTSGGTESDNLAIKGMAWAARAADPARNRVVVSAVEHHAILDPAHWLHSAQGFEVDEIPVDGDGRPDIHMPFLGPDVAVASLMWANNETGTLQPIEDLVDAARTTGVLTHSDAVQAVGSVPVDFGASGLDALTVSGHKLGGPIGVGALLARRGLALTELAHGGAQERARSGTMNAPAIGAFAVAVEAAVADQSTFAARVGALRDHLVAGILASVPDATLNGGSDRLPTHANITFPGCGSDDLLMLLDASGVEVSTGSACTAGVPQPSHVLLAMGRSESDASSSLRFSLGRTTRADDIERAVAAAADAVRRLRHQ